VLQRHHTDLQVLPGRREGTGALCPSPAAGVERTDGLIGHADDGLAVSRRVHVQAPRLIHRFLQQLDVLGLQGRLQFLKRRLLAFLERDEGCTHGLVEDPHYAEIEGENVAESKAELPILRRQTTCVSCH